LSYYFERQKEAGDQAMLWLDMMTYLPDDILVKVDRMTMACSLEARAPLLDHKVVEFMAQVQRNQKFNLKDSKRILRTVAADYLPNNVLHRSKQGFAIPLNSWLKNELRPWVEDLLLSSQFTNRGIFQPDTVRRMIATHVSGRRDLSQQLWALMVIELWFRQIGDRGNGIHFA
jgi:asparagine synthase (glutamine-hydrolysing)